MVIVQYAVDFIFSIALFINALLFIPQALKIFRDKSAKDISLMMFIGFLLIQLAAVLYGIIHQDIILVIGYLLSIVTCSAVIGLTLYYQNKTNPHISQKQQD